MRTENNFQSNHCSGNCNINTITIDSVHQQYITEIDFICLKNYPYKSHGILRTYFNNIRNGFCTEVLLLIDFFLFNKILVIDFMRNRMYNIICNVSNIGWIKLICQQSRILMCKMN